MSSSSPSFSAASCAWARGVACSRPGSTSVSSFQTWHDLLVELELLDDRIPRTEHARQVPARVRQALHEAGRRIGRMKEDHRDPILGPAVAA